MPLSQTPAYNLKAVLKETGIAADTLRAWERRYGLPKPERTPGGHRLYSQRDIHLIKWLMARQAEGLTISRAVDQWNELTASGTDPLADSDAANISSTQIVPTAPTSLDALRTKWLAACLAFNEANAELMLNQAFALYPVEIVATDLIQRGLHEMGAMWYTGEASVQQEHFASALAARRIDALIAAAPAPHRKETLLLACPPDEWHALPLLLLHLLLRRRGWRVVYLGANVPLTQLEETFRLVQPSLVVMSAQQLMSAARLKGVSTLMAERGIPFAYGGHIFNVIPELRAQIIGEFLGESMAPAPERIEQVVEEYPAQPEAPGAEPHPALETYRLNRGLIAASIAGRFAKAGFSSNYLDVANEHFGNALEAALDLGNIAYLESDLDWIRTLLVSHDMPVENLRLYLKNFAQVAHEYMGESARDLTAWLEGYSSRI